MNITTKQFQLLTDIDLVWDFMVDIYDRRNCCGVAAPFFEHAITASWMDPSYSYLDRFWLDGKKIVAFVFYESPVTDIFFNVRKGYEFLADEIIDYTVTMMPDWGRQQLILFHGQEFLMEAAKKRGFIKVYESEDRIFDFKNELNYKLPAGYHFVDPQKLDIFKLEKLCWYGFGHGEKGTYTDWDKEDTSYDWTPAKSHKDCMSGFLAPSPHSTHEYDIIIADDKNDDYVCYSGMWWVPKNKLAYMEPLCTHPMHRHNGLAAAALTEHYRRMKAMGATHMTGGESPFYDRIGYGQGLHWTFWKK